MSHRSLVLVLMTALALALPAAAQERPAAEQKRGTYVIRYASPKDVAAVLAKFFKGAAEVETGPEGVGNNTLLIKAAPAVLDEVIKTAELLDRRPQSVAVEVFVVDLPAKKADDKDAAPIDEKSLTGAIDDVAKALADMQKKGQVAAVKRYQLAAREGERATLKQVESKPYTTGSTVGRAGAVSRNVAYRDVGTTIEVKPQVAEKTVTLDLQLSESRMVVPEDGIVSGTDEKGNAIRAPQFPSTSLSAKVAVASGKAVLAKDEKSSEKSDAGPVLIVVGARVVEPK